MKIGIHIFLKILLILLLFCIFHTSFASGKTIEVRVTEKVPWGSCTQEMATGTTEGGGQVPTGFYKCTVQPGFLSTLELFQNIIKWVASMAAIAGVLYLVVNGIMLSMGGMDSGAKETAKKNISRVIIGLILLLLTGVILNIIAPWVYTK